MSKRLVVLLLALVVLVPGCTRRWAVDVDRLPLTSPAAPAVVPPLPAGTDPIVAVVERVRPAVVNVTTNLASEDALLPEGRSRGTGTGFIVDPDGIIVTNFHVVEGGLSIRVVTDDGRPFEARVIGGDPEADLAVLQVDAESLPTVSLGDSGDLQLGQQVIALGFALALEGGPSVTSGILSAKGRTITAGDGSGRTRTYEELLQTDAAINPGNSGGPLVDLTGQVVGINTAGVASGVAENIGFAIAIDRAKPVIDEAIENPAAEVAYMGVSSRSVDPILAIQLDLPIERGALVLDVAPGGPAAEAGIRPGDILVQIAGQEIVEDEDVRRAIQAHSPGDRIEVALVREDGSRDTTTVTLGVRPLPVPG